MCKFLLKLITVVTALFLVACASLMSTDKTGPEKIQNSSLFQRIGGLPVLTKIVDESIEEIAKSPRTKRSFDGIKLKPLKGKYCVAAL